MCKTKAKTRYRKYIVEINKVAPYPKKGGDDGSGDGDDDDGSGNGVAAAAVTGGVIESLKWSHGEGKRENLANDK